VDYFEDTCHLRTHLGYYYITRVGEDALQSRRMLGGFKEQLGQLGIETLVVEKWNEKAGNVDPRLISQPKRRDFKR